MDVYNDSALNRELQSEFDEIQQLSHDDTGLVLSIIGWTAACVSLLAVAVLFLKKCVRVDELTPAKCAWRISLYLVLVMLSMYCYFVAVFQAKMLVHNKHLRVHWCKKDGIARITVNQLQLPASDVKLHKTWCNILFVLRMVMVPAFGFMCSLLLAKHFWPNAPNGVLQSIFPRLSVAGKIGIGCLFGMVWFSYIGFLRQWSSDLEDGAVNGKFTHLDCCHFIMTLVEKVEETDRGNYLVNAICIYSECIKMKLNIRDQKSWNVQTRTQIQASATSLMRRVQWLQSDEYANIWHSEFRRSHAASSSSINRTLQRALFPVSISPAAA